MSFQKSECEVRLVAVVVQDANVNFGGFQKVYDIDIPYFLIGQNLKNECNLDILILS